MTTLTDVGHVLAREMDTDVSGQEEPEDGLTHMFCCDETKAWCGTDISRAVELVENERLVNSPECSMCALLSGTTCKRCQVTRRI